MARTGIRLDELRILAEIGALNSFGHTRRSALWQVERVIHPAGEMFEEDVPIVGLSFSSGDASGDTSGDDSPDRRSFMRRRKVGPTIPGATDAPEPDDCPLPSMNLVERIHADYQGTSLTLGRHPMALQRDALARRGVLRASDVRTARHGQWVRVAGAVITRQRPGTAKGFVFLTLEDETGLVNVIVRPQLFTKEWITLIEKPFLVIDGVLQNVDNVINVRAERVSALRDMLFDVASHNFH